MRISRRRTRTPQHLIREMKRENLKQCYKCKEYEPIFNDNAWVSYDSPDAEPHLIDPYPDPERELMSKDFLKVLSDEAKELVKIIMSCPEEYFGINGKIKRTLLQACCKEKLGWNKEKTNITTFEVGLLLQQSR